LLAGNARHVLDGWLHVFGNGLGSNEWGAQNASGPWYQFLELLWVIAPVTASFAVMGVVAVCWPRGSRAFEGTEPGARACASLAALLTLGSIAACAFGPNLQYLRIMAPANPLYCLLAALGARSLFVLSEDVWLGRLQALLLPALPLLLAAAGTRDYALYRDVVVRTGMQDLTARWILDGAERRHTQALDSTRQALEAAAPSPVLSRTPQTPERSAAPQPSAGAVDLVGRSVEACRRGAYAECVSASRAALQQDPTSPEAWNNAAAGYAGLRLWDDAIRHAARAIQLRGDFQLAKNNLAWAQAQKNAELASKTR
jgi:tetratricopeptide (TPR) repeat protein